MARSFEVQVSPEVLAWARKTAGVTLADAAKRVGRDAETIQLWEGGFAKPTLAALNELAALYRRTLATLLLSAPPPEPATPPDFRAAQGKPPRLSRGSLLAIRQASWLQSVAREFGVPGASGRFTVEPVADESAGPLADKHRRLLGVPSVDDLAPRGDHQAFATMRAAVEEAGLLVLQLSMPIDELRGFSLTAEKPVAVAVGSGDYIRARIFTLFHEYGHIVLGSGGLCIPQAHLAPAPTAEIERFCNDFAGAFLVPSGDLLSDDRVAQVAGGSSPPADRELDPIAARFHVSRQVLWYRLRALELIDDSVFKAKWKEWGPLQAWWKRRPGRGGPALTAPERRVLQYGILFVGQILKAEARGSATTAEVAEVLGMKVGDLPGLATMVSPL